MKKSGKLIAFPKPKKEKRNTTIQGKVYRYLGLRVTQYYSHVKDSMLVKVEQDGEIIFEEPGAHVTFNSWLKAIDSYQKLWRENYGSKKER
ncbi:hypothetical protein WKH57_25865 [Niallia taxi]|uniref:hypothetical protein n=1 Tax=Niallia taxi TaxID=2499688 RepID=UPI00318245DD